ncbi:efflux RND transporter permease subunit [Azospirillum sp. RWY-5-1]|uniref:Efflux RND transporter permease subunit n=1 Tax=Azospirillum oleiclasticum TaxID=2735135 RepID=A0ABX2TKX8_9PROT|nr:efflux RND transporter permease subunit [Azospirillum oleiclasticum]NYZ17371.1 efflux RND transporter permease subunit [Azospirillum oleiclasticum]NYZ24687.1 efflux RND transporter permease subunit [Azospirillum oleiclasticum]
MSGPSSHTAPEDGAAREGLNLSAWALSHRTLVLFLILASVVAGAVAYRSLGRAEDPSFTFKVMTIRTDWPGATAAEVERLVTDRIEKKLEEVPYYDFARSYSKPGESVVFLTLKDYTPPKQVADIWYQARKKIGDIRHTLPDGVRGPFFNDEFGDVYSAIYALMGEDFTPAQLKRIAEETRERLLRLPDVQKVDLIGAQDERIYVELSVQRLASFGLPIDTVIAALQRENAVAAAGEVDSGPARVRVRVDMGIDSAEKVRGIPIEVDGRLLTVGDVADIRRGYVDPKRQTMRVGGRDAIGVGVVMAKGGNVLTLGERLAAEMARVRAGLPVGVELAQVNDQPAVVERSVGEFMKSLAEALAIVMLVSFVSLGWRTGIVVALAVPLVLALTLVAMLLLGIDLQRISLGALIIALGLLVDDAIIAVEMMVVKMEQGWGRMKAGAYAWTSTAFPMLTGTLVTAAGFVPVGLARSAAGEYTNSIFWVVGISLLLSWVVAVIFTPYLGYKLLPTPKHAAAGHDVYDTRFYRVLRAAVTACVRWRWATILATVGAFAAALVGFGFVQQQFFPSASRPELLVDIRLAEGASFDATATDVARMERILAADDGVEHFTAYTGGGAPRFYLPLDQQLPTANFAQFVVMTKDLTVRERVLAALTARAETDFPAARVRVARLENGPPVGYPVQFRVTGSDPDTLRRAAYALRDRMRADPNLTNVHLDWDELSKRVRLEVDMAKARALGVTRQDLSNALQLLLGGVTVTQHREGTELIDVVVRTPDRERLDLAGLGDLAVRTGRGTMVPLSQVAVLRYELEEPVLWRRARDTTMTVKADVTGGLQAPMVSQRVNAALADLRARLPDGYRIDMGGTIEESAKGQNSINAMLPVMLLIMVTTLMIQLQSFSQLLLVLLTAPLGLIGVTAALLLTGMPFGFVAMLGVIALAGIIMRNSVILVDQIEQDVRAGHSRWTGIIEATVRRTRPIVLTAAAAILAMIPLTHSVFWGPMAVAMMGGLAGATVLTIFFLPALYAAWFRVKAPARRTEPAAGGALRPVMMAAD